MNYILVWIVKILFKVGCESKRKIKQDGKDNVHLIIMLPLCSLKPIFTPTHIAILLPNTFQPSKITKLKIPFLIVRDGIYILRMVGPYIPLPMLKGSIWIWRHTNLPTDAADTKSNAHMMMSSYMFMCCTELYMYHLPADVKSVASVCIYARRNLVISQLRPQFQFRIHITEKDHKTFKAHQAETSSVVAIIKCGFISTSALIDSIALRQSLGSDECEEEGLSERK